MNFAILLCSIVVASAPVALCDTPLSQLIEECGKELNVSPCEVKAFMDNRNDLARATDDIKCMFKCGMDRVNLLKTDGTVDEAALTQVFKRFDHLKNLKIDIEKVLETCKDLKGTNDCDSAFKKAQCLVDESVLV